MTTIVAGSILAADAQTLTNTVNCVGVMGKGMALEFKKRFPDMYRDYVERCGRDEVRPGEPYLYRPPPAQLGLLDDAPRHPWILNFPTKRHWRSRSKISDIKAGLGYLTEHYQRWGIESLAVPPLGCGNGGLDWDEVRPILIDAFESFTVPVTLYAPPA